MHECGMVTLTLSIGITVSHRPITDKKAVSIFLTDHTPRRAIFLASKGLQWFKTLSDLLVKVCPKMRPTADHDQPWGNRVVPRGFNHSRK